MTAPIVEAASAGALKASAVVAATVALLTALQSFLLVPHRQAQTEKDVANLEAHVEALRANQGEIRTDVAVTRRDVEWIRAYLSRSRSGSEPDSSSRSSR